MTPDEIADLVAAEAIETCNDLLRLYAIAQQIVNTEHVQVGTDEWLHREHAKELFDEGVEIFADRFNDLRSW